LPLPLRDARSLPPPSGSSASIRGAAREILARPEFQRPAKPWPQRVLEWIQRLFDRIANVAGPGSVVGLIIVAVVVGVVVVLLVRFGRSVQRDRARGVRVSGQLGRPATDWRAEAAAHEAAGRWRDALRCRYRALVADLAQRGLVDEIPGRTSGEYRSEVTVSLPSAAAEFADATDLFERAWYGAAPAGPEETEVFAGLAERVLTGAGSRR
jgi:hypothetical protein